MEMFILITCVVACQGFPSPKIGTSRELNALAQDKNEKSSALPNLKVSLESPNTGTIKIPHDKTSDYKEIIRAIEKINSLKSGGQSRTFDTLASFAVAGLLAALDLVEEVIIEKTTNNDEDIGNFIRFRRQEETSTTPTPTTLNYEMSALTSDPSTFDTTEYQSTTTDLTTTTDFGFDIAAFATTLSNIIGNQEILNESQENSTRIRQPRQEEEEEEEEGGGGGLLGAIISGFLGSLSKPDGSIDVDAVVSVIGMLSAARDDGTFDFTGLSDTLNAFFGGDDEDGGGSDVGSFFGGLVAAVIKGVASPPGAKGAGSFIGNLLKQLLPVLSGPGPTAEGVTTSKPQVNAGGFLWGVLNSLFGGNDSGTSGTKPPSTFVTIKMNLIKYIFSAFSSILTSSSGGKSKDWTSETNKPW